MEAVALDVPGLGRPFSLGSLYDQKRGVILAQNPWDLNDENIETVDLPGTQFEVEASNDIRNRTNNLGVSAELSLSLAGGTIEISGSAKYASATKSSTNVSSVAFISKRTTQTKKLSQALLNKVTYPRVLDLPNATHFVSSITYGQNAVMTFEADKSEEDTLMDVVGKLKVNIKEIVKGSGELTMTEEERKLSKNLSCKFFGDYKDISPPLNFDQARGMLTTLTENGHGEPIPIRVTLTPINELSSDASRLVRQLTGDAVLQAGTLFQDLEDIQLYLETLLQSVIAKKLGKFKDFIIKMKEQFNDEGFRVKKALMSILPKCKGAGGESEEQSLLELIKDYNASCFNKNLLKAWADNIMDEVDTVDDILTSCTKDGIEVATDMGDFRKKQLFTRELLFLKASFVSNCDPEAVYEALGNKSQLAAGLPLRQDRGDGVVIGLEKKNWEDFLTNFSEFKEYLRVLDKNQMKEAMFGRILFLEFMANENTASIMFSEGGITKFEAINPSAKLENPNYEPLNHIIRVDLERVATANQHSRVQVEVQYKKPTAEDDQEEEESKKHYFDIDESPSTLELDLSKLHPKMEEGGTYEAKARWFIR